MPVTIKLEFVLEKVPPVQMLAPVKAPVEKLTEPMARPLGTGMPSKLIRWDPVVTTPAVVMITVPYSLVRSIPFAQAANGNSSAHRPTITATRLIVPSTETAATLSDNPSVRIDGITKVGLLISRTFSEQSARTQGTSGRGRIDAQNSSLMARKKL
jgi:hypothetical protein